MMNMIDERMLASPDQTIGGCFCGMSTGDTVYLYEHREDANHNDLAITLRALLSDMREGSF